MAKAGFILAKDIYKRGNGRWAKVVNSHRKVGTTTLHISKLEVPVWETYYQVFFGREGELKAHNSSWSNTKRHCIEAAIEWVKFGTVEGL